MTEDSGPRWLLVTPARDEGDRLPILAASLRQMLGEHIAGWLVVDDGSLDNTAESVDWDLLPFPVRVMKRQRGSGLTEGGAFRAFRAGVKLGIEELPPATHVMKLDADVILSNDFFDALDEYMESAGILGGVVPTGGRDREQLDHVPGFVKGYSLRAWRVVEQLPDAIGFDVVDEAAVRQAGMVVVPVLSAHVRLQRTIGESEGTLHGRWRNGRVSRWVGYDPVYFLLRVGRYMHRKPYLLGSLVMLWSYLTAGTGPYSQQLRAKMRSQQRGKLRRIAKSPKSEYSRLYLDIPRCADGACCGQTAAMSNAQN